MIKFADNKWWIFLLLLLLFIYLFIYFFFFEENRNWHFMRIVSEDSHAISSFVSLEKKKKKKKKKKKNAISFVNI